MGERKDRMQATLAALVAACPSRIVTRSFKDFPQRTSDELTQGVLTLISTGEGQYRNLRGRIAVDGQHHMLLVGQLQLAELATGEDLEDAEFDLYEEVLAMLRSPSPALATLQPVGFRQSGQIEHPYGWIAVDLEFLMS